MFNSTFEIVITILGGLFRFLGMLAAGVGLAWFALDVYKKSAASWYLLMALVLGLFGLVIAMTVFLAPGALGGFGLGLGGGLLLFGLLPGRKKDDDDEDDKKGKKK